MYGNGINNPFMMSNMPAGMIRSAPMMGGMMNPSIMGNSMMRGASLAGAPRGGLSSLLGLGGRGGLLSGARSFNLSGLLNNTSKALGVVREAIPIVKEVGPMVGNMKQILKIASVFKDETDTTTRSQTSSEKLTNTKENDENITTIKEKDTSITSTTINNSSFSNEPNFFL